MAGRKRFSSKIVTLPPGSRPACAVPQRLCRLNELGFDGCHLRKDYLAINGEGVKSRLMLTTPRGLADHARRAMIQPT